MYHIYHFSLEFVQISNNELVFLLLKDAQNIVLLKLWRHERSCRYMFDISNKSQFHYASNEVEHIVLYFMI